MIESVRHYLAFTSRRYCAARFVLLPAALAALYAVLLAVRGRSMLYMAPVVCVQLDIFADYRIFGGIQGTDVAGMKLLKTSSRGREFLRNALVVDMVFRFFAVAGTVGACFLADKVWASKPFRSDFWGLGYLILTAWLLSVTGTWIARFSKMFWVNLWTGALVCILEAVCCYFWNVFPLLPAIDMVLAALGAGAGTLAVKTAMKKAKGLPPTVSGMGGALSNIKLGLKVLRYADGPQNSVIWAFFYLALGFVLSFLGKLFDVRALPGEIFLALAAAVPGQCIYSFSSSGLAQASSSRRRLQTSIPAAVTCCISAAIYLMYSLVSYILLQGEPGYREAVCMELAGLAGWLAFLMLLIAVSCKFPRMSVFAVSVVSLLYAIGVAGGWLRVGAGGQGALRCTFLAGLAVILLGGAGQYGLSRLLYQLQIRTYK